MRYLRGTYIPIILACLLAMSGMAHPGSGILVDRHGQVYFIDTGSGLWKIDKRGAVSHLARTIG